jgi:hypothetical protein
MQQDDTLIADLLRENTKNTTLTQRKIDYFIQQLQLAHKRNDLVDQLRFILFQVFFGFQAIIIGASVFRVSETANIKQQLGDIVILVPVLVLIVGYTFFSIFFHWQTYLYKYKNWIRNIETALRSLVFGIGNLEESFTGTLYLDENKPVLFLDGVATFALISMITLNHGVALLLMYLLDIELLYQIITIFAGIYLHILTIIYMRHY